ncbi:MAG: hypothetical protein AAF357_04630 [Verrucomicrobiota bacterium]
MKHFILSILSILIFTAAFPATAAEFPKGLFPDGTTAILRDGKWQLSPPTVDFQEEQLLAEEKATGDTLGRLYNVRNLETGPDIYGGTLSSLEEAIAKAAALNQAENSSLYYVSVGTRY